MKFLKKLFAIIPGIALISVLPTVITSCKTEELHIPSDTTFEIKNNQDLSNFFNSSFDKSSNDYSHVYIYPGNYDYHPSVICTEKVAAVFSSFASNPADTFVGEPNKTIINIDVDVQKATSLWMFPITYATGWKNLIFNFKISNFGSFSPIDHSKTSGLSTIDNFLFASMFTYCSLFENVISNTVLDFSSSNIDFDSFMEFSACNFLRCNHLNQCQSGFNQINLTEPYFLIGSGFVDCTFLQHCKASKHNICSVFLECFADEKTIPVSNTEIGGWNDPTNPN